MRNGARKRTFQIALAASLTLHMMVAAFIHARPVEALPETVPTRIIVHIYSHPKPRPTPRIQPIVSHHFVATTPTHTVAARPSEPHVSVIARGHTVVAPPPVTGEPAAPGNTGTSGPGGAIGRGDVTATPQAECSDPNVDAKTVYTSAAEAPADADPGMTGVVVWIKVDLDAAGIVTATTVYRSSGSFAFDRAALAAARASSYAPEIRNCQPVSGSYLFKVEFSD